MKQQVVPADVYDTYEFAAEVFGGVGAGRAYRSGSDGRLEPFCQHGFRDFLEGYLDEGDRQYIEGINLSRYGVGFDVNDVAVRAVNFRKGVADRDARVSWQEYAEELGLVREEAA